MSKQSCAALLNPSSHESRMIDAVTVPSLSSCPQLNLSSTVSQLQWYPWVYVIAREMLGSCYMPSPHYVLQTLHTNIEFVRHSKVRSVPISLCAPTPISLYFGYGNFCGLCWLLLLTVTGRLLHLGERLERKGSAGRPSSC